MKVIDLRGIVAVAMFELACMSEWINKRFSNHNWKLINL